MYHWLGMDRIPDNQIPDIRPLDLMDIKYPARFWIFPMVFSNFCLENNRSFTSHSFSSLSGWISKSISGRISGPSLLLVVRGSSSYQTSYISKSGVWKLEIKYSFYTLDRYMFVEDRDYFFVIIFRTNNNIKNSITIT